jgi:hypothetical protein
LSVSAGKLLLYLVSAFMSWVLRSTVVWGIIMHVSTVLGAELFLEIIGYVLMCGMAICNENVYQLLIARYYKQGPTNNQDEYIPKSKRRRYVVYLWWIELYDATSKFLIVPVNAWIEGFTRRSPYRLHTLESSRIWKRGITRRGPTIANKRIAHASTRINRYRKLKHTTVNHTMKHVRDCAELLIARCYMSRGVGASYPSTAQTSNQKKNVEPPSLESKSAETEPWDTYSTEVKVESGCSMSISGDIADFIPGTLQEINGRVSIQSYGGGKTEVTHSGIILWKVMDDSNYIREIKLPGALYVPGCSTKLLSPQHLA